MSYVKPRTLGWDPVDVQDFSHYAVYVGSATATDFVVQAEARQVSPFAEVDTNQFVLGEGSGLAEGDYQFAVRTVDVNGNMSDVYQAEVWQNVPLDLTPPPAPTNGTLN